MHEILFVINKNLWKDKLCREFPIFMTHRKMFRALVNSEIIL